MNGQTNNLLDELVDGFGPMIREELYKRLDLWHETQDVFEREHNEAIGGLLARQSSLATNVNYSPMIWNGHILPIVLRSMSEVFINLKWILAQPIDRARLFIEYGLGQEKMAIKKRERQMEKSDDVPEAAVEQLAFRKKMLEFERNEFFIPVNLGAWAGKSIREMAKEIKEDEFYDLVYSEFSPCVHSTWQHIKDFNLIRCTNPLHMNHRNPIDPDIGINPMLFSRVSKYLCMTFEVFDSAILNDDLNAFSIYDFVCEKVDSIVEAMSEDDNEIGDSAEVEP